jgi:hypothetical protein
MVPEVQWPACKFSKDPGLVPDRSLQFIKQNTYQYLEFKPMIGKTCRASSLSVVRMVTGAFDGERRGTHRRA